MSIFAHMFNALIHQDFARATNAQLTPAQQAAINVGAIDAENAEFYCNDLATGVPRSGLSDKLAIWYGVDSTSSVLAMTGWLLQAGNRKVYPTLISKLVPPATATTTVPTTTIATPATADTVVTVNTMDKVNTTEANISTTLPVALTADEQYLVATLSVEHNHLLDYLQHHGIIPNQQILTTIDITAWDVSRAVFIARASYDLGYLDADQAWQIITTAQQLVVSRYQDWEHFAQAYLVGRAIFGERNEFPRLLKIVYKLTTMDTSPWVQQPLATK